MEIRPAAPEDFAAVRRFYDEMIDALQGVEQSPGWTKDVYPSEEDLRGHIAARRLFLGRADGELAAAMAVTGSDVEGYEAVPWQVEAAPEEVFFLHLLAVLPRFARRGLASEMVVFAMDYARQQGGRTLRLDVLRRNLPAERLYARLGFRHVGEARLYYEDTGWADFILMEHAL